MKTKEILILAIKALLSEIESGSCELSDEQLEDSIEFINKILTRDTMSKIEAYLYLNMSKSTFEFWVKCGEIHKYKIRGFKELRFSKSDLDLFLTKHKEYEKNY